MTAYDSVEQDLIAGYHAGRHGSTPVTHSACSMAYQTGFALGHKHRAEQEALYQQYRRALRGKVLQAI